MSAGHVIQNGGNHEKAAQVDIFLMENNLE